MVISKYCIPACSLRMCRGLTIQTGLVACSYTVSQMPQERCASHSSLCRTTQCPNTRCKDTSVGKAPQHEDQSLLPSTHINAGPSYPDSRLLFCFPSWVLTNYSVPAWGCSIQMMAQPSVKLISKACEATVPGPNTSSTKWR